MGKEKTNTSTSVPVLTQIFREEMSQYATPDVKQRIRSGLQQKLAAERTSQNQNQKQSQKQIEQSSSWTTSLSFKAAIYVATILVCVGIVYAVNNYTQMQYNPINAGTQDCTEQSIQDFLAALMNVKTEADMDVFKRKWEIQYSNEYISETGSIYSVSTKSVNGYQYFLGYKKTSDSFIFVWEETLPDKDLPEDVDIFMWVEARLLLESFMNSK